MANKKSIKPAALLIAATLITSCFVGGTLARYVTTTSSEDSARVAVWGINADGVSMDLFNATYELADGTIVTQSKDGDNVIAPGTSKSSKFSIVNLDDTLAPEVMYEIKIDVDDSNIDQRILDNPSIQWKLDNGTWGTWETTKADILALSGDASGSKLYNALEIATEFANGKEHTISWQWLLDNGTDAEDTAMGNAAVNGDITAQVVVKVTAVQSNGETVPEISPIANTSWKLNDTITDFSIFGTFDYENQTGWERMPAGTRISNNDTAYNISGLSMTEALGYEIFGTVFHTWDQERVFSYIPENSLGLTPGWNTTPIELTDLLLNGGTEAELMQALSTIQPTEAPTISFPTFTDEALENEDFINWLKANATQQ